jgi:hypothetical protein
MCVKKVNSIPILRVPLRNIYQGTAGKARLNNEKSYFPNKYISMIKNGDGVKFRHTLGIGATTARVQDHFRFVLDHHLRTVQFP